MWKMARARHRAPCTGVHSHIWQRIKPFWFREGIYINKIVFKRIKFAIEERIVMVISELFAVVPLQGRGSRVGQCR